MIEVPIYVGDSRRLVARRLTAVARGLVALARLDLELSPLPPLYDLVRRGRVRYMRERRGLERWLCPSRVMSEGGEADCEDLMAWRVAELQLGGHRVRALIYPTQTEQLYHAVVRLPDGGTEDPSAMAIAIAARRKNGRG